MQRTTASTFAALSISIAASLFYTPAIAQPDIANIRPEATLSVEGNTLVLNGAGLRSKFVIDVYVAALYVSTPSQDATALINSQSPRRMRLHLLRTIDSKTLDAALQEGLNANTTDTERQNLRESANQLSQLMASIGTAKEGDIVDLDFSANGVSVTYNARPLGHIKNSAFSSALLAVWLGDKPAQTSLKKALLGLNN